MHEYLTPIPDALTGRAGAGFNPPAPADPTTEDKMEITRDRVKMALMKSEAYTGKVGMTDSLISLDAAVTLIMDLVDDTPKKSGINPWIAGSVAGAVGSLAVIYIAIAVGNF